MSSIGRLFDRNSSSIYPLLSRTGGIRPPERRRSRLALTLGERDEISRGLKARCSLRAISRQLRRSPSTISREVRRNGGRQAYRATVSDAAAFDRARRPKPCKLAGQPQLCHTIAKKLERKWSPQQIVGWLKREHPDDEGARVSHETIYRSGPFPDRDRVLDLTKAVPLEAGVPRAADSACRPEMRQKLFLQNAACLDEKASVDRLVRHPRALVIGMLALQPSRDLLG